MLRRLFTVLPAGDRWALLGVLVVMLVAAAFETAGVASILPFMAVVMDPGVIDRSRALTGLVHWFGADTQREALVVMSMLVLASLILGNASAAAGQWVHQRYLARIRRKVAGELFAGYMLQPYEFHVRHDAAALNKVLSNDVEAVVGGALSPIFQAVTRAFVVVGLLAIVLMRDPTMAVLTGVVLGGAYVVAYLLLRNPQARLGEELSAAALLRFRTSIEAFGGIKELMVLGRERATIRRFDSLTARLYHLQFLNGIAALLPRYVLETIAFGGIIFVTLALVLRAGGAAAAIPTLALYAFVGYRLMPALQIIFSAAVTTRFAGAALESLQRDLALVRSAGKTDHVAAMVALDSAREIRLDRVSFTYRGSARPALRDVSVVLKRNESIGLVGRTGAGKTTLADLLLGLYQPTSGTIAIGDTILDASSVRAWRRRVGYVPQSVFLANATIAENIAFGLPPEDVDAAAVARAARMAQAEEFITSLPDGLNTIVGERGVKLSGGQRQRLGIARALYHNPDVLVFDEATSALDGLTEEAVMDAIRSLSGERTIILIAHRLRTVEACDRILLVESGSIIADGSYADLLAHSSDFRRMVGRSAPSAAAS